MYELISEVEVKASPDRVYDWFLRVEEHFVKWHPDHKEFRFTSAAPPRAGTTFHFLQYIGGRKLETDGVVTDLGSSRFAWKARGLPMGGSFQWQLGGEGTRIVQKLSYGPAWPLIGGIVGWFIDRLYLSRRVLQEHLDVEMAGLKSLVDASEG